MLRSITQTKRNFIFDLLRFFLVILVINENNYIATRSGLQNFLYHYVGITVPLFIVLSFYLGNKLFLNDKIKFISLYLRLKRLFIPFYFWSIFGFIVSPNLINIKNILFQIFTGQIVNGPLYYLVLLIWFTLIFWFINYKLSRNKILIYSIIIFISLFLQYSDINYHLFKNSSDAIKYSYGRFVELIPYASIGVLFSYLFRKIKSRSIFFYIAIVFILIYIIIPSDFDPLSTVFYGGRLLAGVIAIFSLILWLSNIKLNQMFNNIIVTLGIYSFGVYLLHYPLLILLFNFYPFLKSFIIFHSYLFLIIYIVICYALCILINLISRRKLSFLIE